MLVAHSDEGMCGEVTFGTAAFQIKEILDPNRRRQDGYEKLLATARTAVKADELLTSFTPKDLTPAEVCGLVLRTS